MGCDINIAVHDELNSDRLPVVMSLVNSANGSRVETEFFYYKREKWNKFRSIINEKINLLLSPNNTDDINKCRKSELSIINKLLLYKM